MGKARILIVEDEAIIAMELESNLQRLGYQVTSIVDTGEKAIEKTELDKPDIILMDIRIKGEIDGIDAADVIRSRFNIPVIFSTAYLDEKRIERAKITMPFGYILKPMQDRDLKVTIEMALYVSSIDQKRKESEQELRVSENKYRTLFSSMLNSFSLHEMIWDEDGSALDFKFLEVNDAFYDLTGYEGNIVGKTATEVYPELSIDSTDRLTVYADVVRTGKSVKFKHFSKLFEQWYSISAFKTDENCFAVVGANITEYIETERALKESEDKYRTYIEEAPYGIFVYDDTGKYIQVNKAARQMLGYSEEEFQKMSVGDLVSNSENVDFKPREGLKKLLETGRVNLVRSLKHKDGHEILINIEAVTVGKNTHLSFHSDITEKDKIEQALKESEENLKRAQKISKTGSWTWNLVTNEVVWTDELYSLFGYQTVASRPENLTFATFLSRIDPDDRAKTELHIKECLERKIPFNFEFRTIPLDNSPQIFTASCDIKIEKGKPVMVYGTVHDITAERKVQDFQKNRTE